MDWEAWVAVGTVSLALATAYLAWQTRRSAKLSRDALTASARPIFADVPPGLFVRREGAPPGHFVPAEAALGGALLQDDWSDIDLSANGAEVEAQVPLRNVGNGLALITNVVLHWPDLQRQWRGAALHTAVPPGELTRLDFVFSEESEEAATAAIFSLEAEQRAFAVEVEYTDVNGGQRTRTRADLGYRGPEDEEEWRVDRILLFADKEIKPFAALSGRGEG